MSNENKVKKRGTSSAPTVLGIIGGILDLPAALCSGACAGAVMGMGTDGSEAAGEAAATAASTYMGLTVAAAVIAIVFACTAKKHYKLAGIMLLVSTVLAVIPIATTLNFMGAVGPLLTLIAGILCFTQKKEVIE